MNLEQVKHEISELGKSPVAERMYPITSDWVPITDVLAIVNRFEKYLKQHDEKGKDPQVTKLINEILGEESKLI